MRIELSNRFAVLREFAHCQSGTALLEFALSAPIILLMALGGAEIAYMATTNMKVNQLAVAVADNASRLGQTDNSGVTPTISEEDVDSIMAGAIEEGEAIDFEQNGRIILSSLERDNATGKQYIHWQRCKGDLEKDSKYGNDSNENGLNGSTITGMGSSGEIRARPNSAVMFVEVYYEYDGFMENAFSMGSQFHEEAAFVIRDDRNLVPGVTGEGGTSAC